MLPLPTVRKLLRECFPEEQLEHVGIICVSEAELQSWMRGLQKRLDCVAQCSAEFVSNRHGQPYVFLNVAGAADSYPDNRFHVKLASHGDIYGVWISDSCYRPNAKTEAPPAPVCDISQIEVFLETIKARIARDSLRDKRTEKVTGLKKTGLTARLRDLGEQHGFSFAIGESKRDINLSIRVLGRKKGYHFSFAKGKLDAVIDQVPDLVAMLQKLQRLGVAFRTSNSSWSDRQGDWIEPPEPSESTLPSDKQ